MNLSHQTASGKPNMPTRYRPSVQEGLYIQYRINLAGHTLAHVARMLHMDRSTVSKVIRGKRRSCRLEKEVARIFRVADWNAVVLEARSEIQKKPVKVILEEMRQAREGRMKAVRERMGEYIAHNTPDKAQTKKGEQV